VLQPSVVRIVGKVGGDAYDCRTDGHVFRPIVDEDRFAAWAEEVIGSISPLVVTIVFAVELINKVVNVELYGPAAAVDLSARAPPNDWALLATKMDQQLPSARSKRGAGQ
jgi:hypothetical protein